MRLLATSLTCNNIVIESVEEIDKGTVGLAELLLPGRESLDTLLIGCSLGRRTKDAHFHFLCCGLVKDIEHTQVELVTIMTDLHDKLLECSEGMKANTGM
jgi:hypothetical protein